MNRVKDTYGRMLCVLALIVLLGAVALTVMV